MVQRSWIAAAGMAACIVATPSHALTVREAIQHALNTNPEIGLVQAEKRATGYELRQSKGRLFPQVNLEAFTGDQKMASEADEPAITADDAALVASTNNKWLNPRQIQVSASQILFDGFERIYDIYKNAARLDVAALRVLDRGETTGLEVVESFIDVRRYRDVVGVARRNVNRHQQILELVKAQFEGGKVPLSDVNQIRGRLAAAEAVVAVSRRQLLDAEAAFVRVVDLQPRGLQTVSWPPGMPGTKQAAIQLATIYNPSLRAAVAGVDVARHERDAQHGTFLPSLSLEGSARYGEDIDGNRDYENEYVGKLVLRWNLFDGMIRHNRRRELTERLSAAQLRTDVRRRDIVEGVERSWASLVTGAERLTALNSQVSASEKVVVAFLEEYELARRTLLEVLDAESLLFNARVQRIGAESIRLFAAHQLLASAGRLLSSYQIAAPAFSKPNAQARDIDHLNTFDVFLGPLSN